MVSSGSAHLLHATDESQKLRLAIGLKTPHTAEEDQFLASLQDKSSPNFHRYLTAEQWNARFAPSAADEQKVVDWAQANGISVTRKFSNHLVVDLESDVGTVEKALNVSINSYSLGGREFYSNATTPQLPSSVSDVVQAVGGLNSLEVLKPQNNAVDQQASSAYAAGAAVSEGPAQHADGSATLLAAAMSAAKAKTSVTGGFYDPSDIYASTAYDTDALNRQGHCCNPTHVSTGSPPATSIAIASVGLQQLSDMQGFHNLYPYLAYSYDTRYIDGTPSGNDLEGTMDLEWSTAMANSFGSYLDTAHVRMYNGANNLLTTFTDIYNSMLSDGVARVMSTSWGCAESYCASSGLMNTQHNIFNAMLGQGWSLTAASDDSGPYADCSHVSVSYPSSDPDVVAAGGTTLQAAGGFFSEVAWTGGSSAGSCSVNNGGGGGGCSVQFTTPAYQTNNNCAGWRSVPDVSLNASIGQNIFFGGVRRGSGGTSIVAPELAGFFAQENAYLISMGNVCGLSTGNLPCGPMGNANVPIYRTALSGAPHNPFYDVTSGCTSNDVGGGWCATTGYDRATGFGSFNMLMLAWGINYWETAETTSPTVNISGPSTGVWYDTNQTLSWAVSDGGGSFGASGNAGYTYRWDADPGNPTFHATPGTGDPFYYGPAYPKASTGAITLASAGQGCHTLYVRAWDNLGLSTVQSYGPVCYDTGAPSISSTPHPKLITGQQFNSAGVPVQILWAGSDSLSGISSYSLQQSIDGAAYTGVGLSSPTSTSVVVHVHSGHNYRYQVRATDRAGNVTYGTGSTFTLSSYENTSTRIAYSSSWTQANESGASGGNVKYTASAGKTAKLTFTGTQVALVSEIASTNGSATVKLDSAASSSISTYGTTTKHTYVSSVVNYLPAGTHTYLVTGSGTSGHPRVEVDTFLVIS